MNFSVKVDLASGQRYIAVRDKGRALLLHPVLNKGTAFSRRERDELDLEGLVPPRSARSTSSWTARTRTTRRRPRTWNGSSTSPAMQDRNETLFYRMVLEHIDEMMPIVYTPVVGEACQKFSHIYRRGRGLYIAYEERHRIPEILRNSGIAHPSVIVVTDGERILGLGDQGAGGMGIPIGKLCLYTLCAGISPVSTLPITLDAGTDNPERLEDPLYLGMRHKRIRGEAYQEFVDAFVDAVQEVFPDSLLQWEDFLKENAIFQLARFRDRLCTFNDDIQGTAGVVVAGLFGALRITGKRMADQRVVFAGAGASAQGISELIVSAMMEDGLSHEEAVKRIWTADSRGLVTRDRPNLEAFKATFAREHRGAGHLPREGPRPGHAAGDHRERESHHPHRDVGHAGPVRRADRSRDGQGERSSHRLPAVEPHVQVRVHGRGRHALDGGPRHRGQRQPVPARGTRREALPHRPVQQRVHLPRCGAGPDGEPLAPHHRRHVPGGRQGAGRAGHRRRIWRRARCTRSSRASGSAPSRWRAR